MFKKWLKQMNEMNETNEWQTNETCMGKDTMKDILKEKMNEKQMNTHETNEWKQNNNLSYKWSIARKCPNFLNNTMVALFEREHFLKNFQPWWPFII